MKNLFSPLLSVLLITTLSGCIRWDQKAQQNCIQTGNEKYALFMNGVQLGLFRDYTVSPASNGGGVITFEGGLIPPSPFVDLLKDKMNLSLTDRHDLIIFSLQEGKVDTAVSELLNSAFVNIDGAPSLDNPECLIIEKIIIDSEKITNFSGRITNSRVNVR